MKSTLLDTGGNSRLPDKVWGNVGLVGAAVYDTIRHVTKPGRSFIFTNELLEDDARARKVLIEIARMRGALFVPVRLTISPTESSRRVVSPGRAENFKETDPEAARKKAKEHEVLRPHGFAYLEIDVTSLSPEEVAGKILLEAESRRGYDRLCQTLRDT